MNESDDYAEAARLLAKLEPGFLPFDIFQQLARLVTLPIVEIVPLRTNAGGEIEVLLLKRADDDPIFPGQLHTPGCVVRPTDTPGSFESAFQRILDDELAGVQTSEPVYVSQLLHHSGRGMESANVYRVEVRGEPRTGAFYPANNLPANFMPSQLDFVPRAIADYRSTVAADEMSAENMLPVLA